VRKSSDFHYGDDVVTESGEKRDISWGQLIALFAGPVLAFAVYFVTQNAWPHSASATAAVGVWMAVWWITEAIPLPATALLPIVLLPILGTDGGPPRVGQVVEISFAGETKSPLMLARVVAVDGDLATVKLTSANGDVEQRNLPWRDFKPTQKTPFIQTVTAPYGDSNIFLYMGGFILALAVERWGLHRRFAIGLLMLLGTSGASILLGMMLATALLSMWISNTAATTIMLPIALGICRWLDGEDDSRDRPSQSRREGSAASMLLLSIAYAATIGGMATTIGTPTNGVALNVLKQQGIEISFLSWLMIAGPISLFILVTTWIVLLLYFKQGFRSASPRAADSLRSEWDKLGRMRYEEWAVLTIFLLTASAWIFRGPIQAVATGSFGSLMQRIDDTVIAMVGALLLFVVPANWKARKFLLDWQALSGLPWGVLLIFGGGLSLAAAMQSSGLVQEMEGGLEVLKGWPIGWMVLAIVIAIVFLSEMASNVAIATAFTPIIFAMALAIDGSPKQLVIAATLAASCGFMLPVATPPNAIVFGTGRIDQQQMLRVGLILNILSSLIVAASVRWLA
jgi:solute carrier family 13 (sodium-dependent dicarboxylate transporter), member 2/3/5